MKKHLMLIAGLALAGTATPALADGMGFVRFEAGNNEIEASVDTNGRVKSRLATSRSARASLRGTAEDFMATLVAMRDGATAGDVVKPQAMLNLKGLIGTLNANMNGQFLFSGINTDVRPLADYEGAPPSAAKTSIGALAVAVAFTEVPDCSSRSSMARVTKPPCDQPPR